MATAEEKAAAANAEQQRKAAEERAALQAEAAERDAKAAAKRTPEQATDEVDTGNVEGVQTVTLRGVTMMPEVRFRVLHDGYGIFAKGNVVTLAQLGGDIEALMRPLELGAIEETDAPATPSNELKLLI